MISVAAVPLMRGLGGSQSSRAAAQILVSALEQARTAAILSGTNAFLLLADPVLTTSLQTNTDALIRLRTFTLARPTVDQDGNSRDDFATNSPAPGWVQLGKWERLPADLVFSPRRLGALAQTTPALVFPPPQRTPSPLRQIGFTPSGELTETNGTNGLLFASARITNAKGEFPADRIEVSYYSGRVRYVGLVTNNPDF